MKKNAEYISLFPNVMLGIHKDHYFSFWLEPIKNNYTLEHLEVYYVGNKDQLIVSITPFLSVRILSIS